jgi:hypothetical protein
LLHYFITLASIDDIFTLIFHIRHYFIEADRHSQLSLAIDTPLLSCHYA